CTVSSRIEVHKSQAILQVADWTTTRERTQRICIRSSVQLAEMRDHKPVWATIGGILLAAGVAGVLWSLTDLKTAPVSVWHNRIAGLSIAALCLGGFMLALVVINLARVWLRREAVPPGQMTDSQFRLYAVGLADRVRKSSWAG